MLISEWYHLPTFLSLGVIGVVLTIAIVASLKRDVTGEDVDIDTHGIIGRRGSAESSSSSEPDHP